VIFFDPDDMDECLQDLDNDEEPSSVEDFTLSRGVVGKGVVDFTAPGTRIFLYCLFVLLLFIEKFDFYVQRKWKF
jgi:hypothetical protein